MRYWLQRIAEIFWGVVWVAVLIGDLFKAAFRHKRRIAVNLFYLVVVWLVLDQFDQRPEAVILPVLGMLYVEIRRIQLGMGVNFSLIGMTLGDIRTHLNLPTEIISGIDMAKVFATLREDQPRMWARFFIDAFFLTAIFLLCLWKFFTAL